MHDTNDKICVHKRIFTSLPLVALSNNEIIFSNTSWSAVSFAVEVFVPTLIGSCCFGKLSAVVPGRTQVKGGDHPRGGAVEPSQTGGALVFLLQPYGQATWEIIKAVNFIGINYQKGFLN